MSEIQFKCPKCKSETFKAPRADLRDTDKLTCTACGFRGTYVEICGPQALQLVTDQLKKALKGFRP